MASNELKAEGLGGQLGQAKIGGFNIFYEAPANLHKLGDPKRGGVPVLFPQFNLAGNFAKHGFVRTLPWRVNEQSGGVWSAELFATSKNITPHLSPSSAEWLDDAKLTLTAKSSDNSLEVMLAVQNIGDTAFAFTGGLHPYFAWCAGDAQIPELGINLSREEMMVKGAGVEERVGTADHLTLAMSDYRLTIRRLGFHEWMLWNPGPKHTLSDIAPDDWQRFICLEPVSIDRPHSLAPGQMFEGGFSITLEA